MTVPSQNPDFKEKGGSSFVVQSAEAETQKTTPPVVTATAIPVAVATEDPPRPPPDESNQQPDSSTATKQPTLNVYTVPLGRSPQTIHCPYCDTDGTTVTKGVMSGIGIGGAILCCFLCWPFFWVPLVCRDCRTVVHYCPNCHREVGEGKPFH